MIKRIKRLIKNALLFCLYVPIYGILFIGALVWFLATEVHRMVKCKLRGGKADGKE